MGAQIGDIVSQDRAYTIGILLKLLSMFELEWSDFGMEMPLESIFSCMFLLLTCLGGMRGYEAVWTDLAHFATMSSTANQWMTIQLWLGL